MFVLFLFLLSFFILHLSLSLGCCGWVFRYVTLADFFIFIFFLSLSLGCWGRVPKYTTSDSFLLFVLQASQSLGCAGLTPRNFSSFCVFFSFLFHSFCIKPIFLSGGFRGAFLVCFWFSIFSTWRDDISHFILCFAFSP